MSCDKEKVCPCPKTDCENYKRCCACVTKHRDSDSMPFCLFPDNGGDKSMENLHRRLKERFED